MEIRMPPRSYMIAAVVLGTLVGVSFFLAIGFSMTVWSWMFGIAACILGVAGAFNVAGGLDAPRWIGFALASPGLAWAAGSLREWIQSTLTGSIRYEVFAVYFAALAAGAGALKLIDMMSRLPRAVVYIGYALLAVTALWVGLRLIAIFTQWPFFETPYYFMAGRTVFAASTVVEYGAFMGAAVLITIRRDVESWAAVAICLVSSFLIFNRFYTLILLRQLESSYGFLSWLQPVAIFIAAAAVWRMGSLLRDHPSLKPLEHPSPA
jgi:hypothetical protein